MLKRLLAARRNDLVDGFPCKAVVAASQHVTPLLKLNEQLIRRGIVVELIDDLPSAITLNPYLLEFGIISAHLMDKLITVRVNSNFFNPAVSTAVVKGLCFQSVCLHQLVHRLNGTSCQIFYRDIAEALNDEQELEAIAAGLAHDIRVKGIISQTGDEAINELSPRLANMLDNSSDFEQGSLTKLQMFVKQYA